MGSRLVYRPIRITTGRSTRLPSRNHTKRQSNVACALGESGSPLCPQGPPNCSGSGCPSVAVFRPARRPQGPASAPAILLCPHLPRRKVSDPPARRSHQFVRAFPSKQEVVPGPGRRRHSTAAAERGRASYQ